MIGRKSQGKSDAAEASPQSFDDFKLKLGDMMRGERATLGKSLLDVQRELRIKASYIAAIENCDPSAFDTPGFIAGYVRSYARYLGMNPEEAFGHFCAESGFSTAHGMSDKASTIRKPLNEPDIRKPRVRDPFAEPSMPFAPKGESFLARIEPGAVGSSLVLIALISGIGYGGWTVLQEVQRVQLAPIEQTPTVLSELDPLDAAVTPVVPEAPRADDLAGAAAGVFTPPSNEAFDRLYRPQALDVPVLIARDAPISSLDPNSVGSFAQEQYVELPQVQDSSLAALARNTGLAELPTALPHDGVTVIAARPAWVQVKDNAGKVLLSRVLDGGETFDVPVDAVEPEIRIGEAGAVYFMANGITVGPAGQPGQVESGIPLVSDALLALFEPPQLDADQDLGLVLAQLNQSLLPEVPETATRLAQSIDQAVGSVLAQAPSAAESLPRAPTRPTVPLTQPRVLAEGLPEVVVVATADTWVEVTSATGKKLFASVLKAGQTYVAPPMEQAPSIFSGNAGGVYFAVNGQTYGPYGQSGQHGRGLTLASGDITQRIAVADIMEVPQLAKTVAELNSGILTPQE